MKYLGFSLTGLVAAACSATPAMAAPLALTHVTVIDATGRPPVEDAVIVMDEGRIISVGRREQINIPRGSRIIDQRGKYVIPGLMDANVHLYLNLDFDSLLRLRDRYADVIIEGAQLALKSGLTTVFDTWGPYPDLSEARERIRSGKDVGSRLFFAGNIIGLDGPLSDDFLVGFEGFINKKTADYINRRWTQGTGRQLIWDASDEIHTKVSKYAARDVDFLKYASNGHKNFGFLEFPEKSQSAIVRAGHEAGKVVQAHVHSAAGIEAAMDAGVDILTHCDITPERVIPAFIIKQMAEKQISCSVLPVTKAYQAVQPKQFQPFYINSWANIKSLVDAGVNVMLSTDAGIEHPLPAPEPETPIVDNRTELGKGHLFGLVGLEQLKVPPMKILQIATINVARGYKVDKDFGTLEPGKYADMVVLDRDPLASAANYESIAMVIKEGRVVDRTKLPSAPLISNQKAPPLE